MSSSLSCQHSTQHSDDIMCTNSKTHPQTQHSFGKLHLLPRWKMLWRHIGENGDPEADFFFLRGDTSSVELWAYRWTTNRFGWCSDVPVELWPKSYRYQVVKAWHLLLFSEFESHRNRFFGFFFWQYYSLEQYICTYFCWPFILQFTNLRFIAGVMETYQVFTF